jgi:hypothetical protein
LTFVSVFRRAVSYSFPCLSCRPCLPLRFSFPVAQNIFPQRGIFHIIHQITAFKKK